MTHLIKILILIATLLLFDSCSLIQTKVASVLPKISSYPSKEKLILIINPPIVIKKNHNLDKNTIRQSIYFLYSIAKNKNLLNIKNTHRADYAKRFDNIIIKKWKRQNKKKLYDKLEIMERVQDGENFSYNGIVQSDIEGKEPTENTLKIGFAIVDKSYPYIKGYRSIKEKGKLRYTEFVILQNKEGDSHDAQDMKNLIKFFILMPIHKYKYKLITQQKITAIKNSKNHIHIVRYIIPEQYVRMIQIDYSQDKILLRDLNLTKNDDMEGYCSLFNMKATGSHLDDGYKPYLDKFNKVFYHKWMLSDCKHEYIYKKIDTKLNYSQDKFNKIIQNNFISNIIKPDKLSPILDLTSYDSNIYISKLDGSIEVYSPKNHTISHFQIAKKPLTKIIATNKFIYAGSSDGYLYIIDKSDEKFKIFKKIKIFNFKITDIKLISFDTLIISSLIGKVKTINTKSLKQNIVADNKKILKKLGIYNQNIIYAFKEIKLLDKNYNLIHTYTGAIPITTISIYNDNLFLIYGNNIAKWNLKKPYNLLNYTTVSSKQGDILADMILYKNLYILSSIYGHISIYDENFKQIKAFNINNEKINKLLYFKNKIYIATHSGLIYVLDIKLGYMLWL